MKTGLYLKLKIEVHFSTLSFCGYGVVPCVCFLVYVTIKLKSRLTVKFSDSNEQLHERSCAVTLQLLKALDFVLISIVMLWS